MVLGQRRTDAIVFDWDGTLCDSMSAIFEANRRVLEELGLPFDLDRYRAAYVPDWRLMYRRLGVPDDALEATGRRWLELYTVAAEAGLLPGVKDALERLVKAGFVLGLVTAGDRGVVTGQLERFGIAHLIRARVFGNDDIASKPHPDPLRRVLEELGRSDNVAFARYVGDVPDDMRMARAVGTVGIGIESEIGTREELIEAGAHHVFPSVAAFVSTLLAPGSSDDNGVAIVVAGGAVPERSVLDAAWPGWATAGWDHEDDVVVIAADGGAYNARALGLPIHRWVGDGDSIDPGDLEALAASGVEITRLPIEKNTSDAEEALLAAFGLAEDIVVLGALGGGRIDHALANLGLLQHPSRGYARLVLYDEFGARITLLEADDHPRTHLLDGRVGDLVTLQPVTRVARGVTTERLQYPLNNEDLELGRTRGLSNVVAGVGGRVSLESGRLLVIETPVTVGS